MGHQATTEFPDCFRWTVGRTEFNGKYTQGIPRVRIMRNILMTDRTHTTADRSINTRHHEVDFDYR